MSAEIIQFGSPRVPARAASRQTAPITSRQGEHVDLHEERAARDKAWDKLRIALKYCDCMLDMIDRALMVWQVGASEQIPERYRAALPDDWDAHHAERDVVRDAQKQLTARLLLQPAAYASHVIWKEQHLRSRGGPITDLSVKQIERQIEADKAFLAACPRKRGGYHRGRGR